ncbi:MULTISPECIES: glucokinase [unclassified Undibacterium]|uniref:glucokinase n=1 Tax=unclassified Undibacterium TaxID=2630295 RepID=UPI002AC930DA|nr:MULTISPECIES: glucokinase [unclassified Undibacterium]MEB0139393.1 glucokinase [Undibacterium sp. CCC2.1]MEB0173342.1 glucokinase [Undibacterium sp. CCC1.1]MEB0177271.1 glucokinase [Undibacterium sp. CCC3.4]MEB0216536.1 glucokinase [Undibacterium sp. 5I2]WPX44036.1 glucokinase [Undibacterium sp. CCC3.4]
MNQPVLIEHSKATHFPGGPRLLADIGATHARFTLETAAGVFQAVQVLKCDEYGGMVELMQAYWDQQQVSGVQHAALAIAYPIDGDYVRMTNRAWEFSIDAVRAQFSLHTLLIVNDFTALAMALPHLQSGELMQVGAGTAVAKSVIGVLGPGTGLGVSGLIPTSDGFVTLGSEGGHANFAPSDEREFSILQFAWQEWSHVSAERLISGPGMELIHRALAARNRCAPTAVSAQEITRRALSEAEPLCLETLECFCGMLGSFSANLAVTLGACGGMYIGGGIIPLMGEWFTTSPFRARFEAKGRFRGYLAQIPTYVITTPNPAFYGVSAILSEHLRGRSADSSLLDRIQQIQATLTPAERRVATLILANPRSVLNEAIVEIARQADVSQPTVIRFCRSLGFTGLADFKLKFASSLNGTIPVRHSQVRRNDSTHDLSAKVIDNTVSAILQFRDQLDVHAIERAIAFLHKANKLELYAMGNSRAVALDAQHKFFRFRIPTAIYGDAHLFLLAAELLKPGDVVIVISNSGKLPELLHAVDAALFAGAAVIVLAPHQSPLAKKATVCLAVNHTEDNASFLAMVSRILQLLLIDILTVGLSLEAPRGETGLIKESSYTRFISHLDS